MKRILILLILLFAGCQHVLTYNDLLENPQQLKKEINYCRNHSEDLSYCKMVQRAADGFYALQMVRQQNPEQFGLQILQAEQELVKEQLANQDYREAEHKVKVLLGIVGEDHP